MGDKETWVSPIIEELGDARELIKSVSVAGSGDSQFSILQAS